MASTTQRGYGWAHQQLRAQLLAQLKADPGQPCPRCGNPMYAEQHLDLDHTDDRTAYQGLAHRRCNRLAGSVKGNHRRWSRKRFTPSRLW